MKTKKRVALAFPIGLAHLERLVGGILEYAGQRGDWVFTRLPEMLSPSIGWLRHWPGDGAMVLVTNGVDARTARGLRMPVVNLAGHLADPGVPTVTVDHRATGRLAAEHLLERRFRRFGFYGTAGKWFSGQRRDGFLEVLRAAGASCRRLEVKDLLSARSTWTNQQAELERWLRQFRRPVGILASTDLRAVMVNEACQRLGLRVPEDVALVGVDNDTVACEMCHPTLTSVSRNDRKVGWEAAALLELLMRGERPRELAVRVLPDGVVRRGSTETLAIDDAPMAALVEEIRKNLRRPFGVERLLEAGPWSRRQLERRFRESLGCSPYTFINTLRVERARQLLLEEEPRTLSDIAAQCGFSELRRFRLVFRRLSGVSPAAFRREQRRPGGD